MRFNLEKWEECVEDMRPLWALHWKEAYQEDVIPVPDEETYQALSNIDKLKIVTARDNKNTLWGYAWFLIHPNIHDINISSAIMDLWFVHPTKRAGGNSVKMLRFAEKKFLNNGITHLYGGHSSTSKLQKLFEKLGFKLTEYHYTKRLKNG